MPVGRTTNGSTLNDMVDALDERDDTDYGDAVEVDEDSDEDAGEGADDGGDADGGDDSGSDDGGSGSDADGSDSRGDHRSQQVKNGKQPADDMRKLPNGLLQDKQGNLVHPQTGAIIARAGESRRHYERAQRIQSQLDQTSTRVTQLQQQLEQTRVLNDMPRTLGLSNEDLQVALPLVGEFVKNPLVAARKIVEMVASMGHNLSDILGQGADGSIEMAAVSRMLDERLKPLKEIETQRTQAQNAEAERTRAEQAVQDFFNSHENAEMHAQEIDNLIGIRVAQGDKNITPEKAYYELQVFAAQNGLDFSRPLKPQVEALQRANGQQTDTSHRHQTRSNRSLPNGRGGAPRTMAETEFADSNAGWDDIIKGALSRNRNMR